MSTEASSLTIFQVQYGKVIFTTKTSYLAYLISIVKLGSEDQPLAQHTSSPTPQSISNLPLQLKHILYTESLTKSPLQLHTSENPVKSAYHVRTAARYQREVAFGGRSASGKHVGRVKRCRAEDTAGQGQRTCTTTESQRHRRGPDAASHKSLLTWEGGGLAGLMKNDSQSDYDTYDTHNT